MSLKYRGDHTGTYDRKTQRGLVGKVVGPDAAGGYRVIVNAVYDAQTDTTTANTQLVLHPERRLAEMEGNA